MPSIVRTFFKLSLRLTFLALGCSAITLGLLFLDKTPIFIESEESKTAELKPVYNRIVYHPGTKTDTWIMQQSHIGPKAQDHEFDKIAIVVDKGRAEAHFLQLNPSQLEDLNLDQTIDLRASCYMCHSNGPRAIRPIYNSKEAKLGMWDKLRITAWNLRIKTYGPLTSTSKKTTTAFRLPDPILNEQLTVKACTKCHNSTTPFARNPLTRQNFMSIRFMVEKGYMPPMGIKLSGNDKFEIKRFTGGN